MTSTPVPGIPGPGVVTPSDGDIRNVRRRSSRIRESGSDRVVLVTIYVVLTLIAVIILFPLIYILAASFSSGQAVIDGKVWLWPVHPTLEATPWS